MTSTEEKVSFDQMPQMVSELKQEISGLRPSHQHQVRLRGKYGAPTSGTSTGEKSGDVLLEGKLASE